MPDLIPATPAPSPGTPLILVGMMGSGKTTVGRRLAQRLGRRFIDLDKELEARCGVPVATIFELEGEAGFRQREAQLIEELTASKDLVIATGGGAVLREDNRRRLRERGYVIHLRASLPELWHRLRHDKVRPLLRTADPRGRIAELLQARDPLYDEVAHLSVLTGRQPADRVVVDIIGLLPPALLAPAAAEAAGPAVPDRVPPASRSVTPCLSPDAPPAISPPEPPSDPSTRPTRPDR